jgi:hypothetical protein
MPPPARGNGIALGFDPALEILVLGVKLVRINVTNDFPLSTGQI